MAATGAGHQAGIEFLQVQTMCDSRAEAMALARAAVEARLAAGSQVAGPMASTFWWNDEIERAEEWFVFFKTTADRAVDMIRDRFGWQAVGYGSVVLGHDGSVPDAFRELAEKDL